MILDLDNQFSATAAGDNVTATGFAPNAVDGSAARDAAAGKPVFAYARVGTVFDGLTSLKVEVGGADDAAGTNFVAYGAQTYLLAALTANTLLPRIYLSPGLTKKKFLVCKYTVAGSANVGGTITVGLTSNDAIPQNQAVIN